MDPSPPPDPREATGPGAGSLRRWVLAAAVLEPVLESVTIAPADDGVLVGEGSPALLPWSGVALALGPARVSEPIRRRRLARWLALHALAANDRDAARALLRRALRPVALPDTHALYPGPCWPVRDVLGGVLHVGPGLLGLLGNPDEVAVAPPDLLAAVGLDPAARWEQLSQLVEAMGALAVQRLARDAGRTRDRVQEAVLRPVGGCDVPTLLASATLRSWLAGQDGSGMRAIAVPMRTRGWYDLARIDPAFVAAAWSATDEEDRGLAYPLLITAEEVAHAPDRGDVVAQSLRDDVGTLPALRDVRG